MTNTKEKIICDLEVDEENRVCEVPPCLYTLETGKHEWTCLHWRSQTDGLFSIPQCPECGWIDTRRMVRELSFWRRLRVLFLIY